MNSTDRNRMMDASSVGKARKHIWIKPARVLVLVAALFALNVTSGWSAAGPFVFSESLKEKVKCDHDAGCEVLTSGKFKISATISLTNVVISAFSNDTPFSISVGGSSGDFVLGDDPKYTAGDTSASFTFEDADGKKVVKAKLKWNEDELKVKITAITPDEVPPILADAHIADPDGDIADTTTATVTLGGASTTFDVEAAGTVKRKTTTKGEDEFDLGSVKLKGTGEVPPIL